MKTENKNANQTHPKFASAAPFYDYVGKENKSVE